ncbi:MAG: GDP-L-fucose synthase [Gammaproteobacteria bacterium]|nr:MAG: GDP-L-fucose synthase [Gammaproteobacteria bacterium]TND07062.1 MAG: GDP-L-fucose synthase [Gammaproteobacteria bacterium]
MDKQAKIYVAGHLGLVGSALVRKLEEQGFSNIVTATRKQLDLRDNAAVAKFFSSERPDYVYVAAAKVGGILANDTYPAEFLYDNLMIEANLIHEAYRSGVEKLLFLGSTCIYPKLAPQPLKEEYLLTGALEPTNEWYAVAKIAGIKLCQAYRRQYGCRFIAAMPTNLYGPGDNFDLNNSHVLPALIRKFHDARLSGAPTVTVWGTGSPRREFLHSDDCADACLFLMGAYDNEGIINIGVGKDIPIRELAMLVGEAVGYRGDIVFDTSKPDGTPRKLVDVGKLTALGWTASIPLADGIRQAYRWFLQHPPGDAS